MERTVTSTIPYFRSSLVKMAKVCIVLVCLPLMQLARCDNPVVIPVCKQISTCECLFNDGTGVISLETLVGKSSTGPLFPYQRSPVAGSSYWYAYNPCNSFTDSYCTNVAACQRNELGTENFDVGDQDTALMDDSGTLITYSNPDKSRISLVTLICDLAAVEPKLEVKGEDQTNKGHFLFSLTSRCACKDGCLNGGGGISLGSWLCILFSVGFVLYIVIGFVFLKFVRGAEGREVIPNYAFWSDFPYLVKDGFLFIGTACKGDTNNYEQI